MQSPGALERFGQKGGHDIVLARFVRTQFLLLPVALLLSSCVFWTPMSQTPTPSATVISNVPMQKWDIKSCGAGALSTVLQHYGDPTTMKDWDVALPKTRGRRRAAESCRSISCWPRARRASTPGS
jgi:hypothetical protein